MLSDEEEMLIVHAATVAEVTLLASEQRSRHAEMMSFLECAVLC